MCGSNSVEWASSDKEMWVKSTLATTSTFDINVVLYTIAWIWIVITKIWAMILVISEKCIGPQKEHLCARALTHKYSKCSNIWKYALFIIKILAITSYTSTAY